MAKDADVAQLVEQLIRNEQVTGSIPAIGSISFGNVAAASQGANGSILAMRDFEKISFDQFKKDVADDRALYDSFELPMRKTKNAAGYDFPLLQDLTIKPGEIVKLPTGLKIRFNSDEVLLVTVRSSTGFKYNIRLVNQIGIIDSDYYNNPDNEGHLFVKIQNEGDKTVTFKAGDAVAQGIFVKYLTTDTERTLDSERTSDY